MKKMIRRALIVCTLSLTTSAALAQSSASLDQSALVMKNLAGVADSIASLREDFKPENVRAVRDQLQRSLNVTKGLAAAGGALAAVSAIISIIEIIENKPTADELIRKEIAQLGDKVDNLQDYLGDTLKRGQVYASLQADYQTLTAAEDNLRTAAALLSAMNSHDFVNQRMIGTKPFVDDAIRLARLCNIDNDTTVAIGGPSDQWSIFKKIDTVYFGDEVMLLNANLRLSSALVEGQVIYGSNYLKYVSDKNNFDSFSNGLEIIIDRNNPAIQSIRNTWNVMFPQSVLNHLAEHVERSYISKAGTGDTNQRSMQRQQLVKHYLEGLDSATVLAIQHEFALVTAEAHFAAPAQTCATSFAKISRIDRKSFEAHFANFIDYLLNDSDRSYADSAKLVRAMETKYPSKAWAAVVYGNAVGFENHLISADVPTKWVSRLRHDRHGKTFHIGYEDELKLANTDHVKLRIATSTSTQSDLYKSCGLPGFYEMFKRLDLLPTHKRESNYAKVPELSFDNFFDQCYQGCTGRALDYPGHKDSNGQLTIPPASVVRTVVEFLPNAALIYFKDCPNELNDLRYRSRIGRINAALDTGPQAPYYTLIMGRTEETGEPDIAVSGNWENYYTKDNEYWAVALSNELD